LRRSDYPESAGPRDFLPRQAGQKGAHRSLFARFASQKNRRGPNKAIFCAISLPSPPAGARGFLIYLGFSAVVKKETVAPEKSPRHFFAKLILNERREVWYNPLNVKNLSLLELSGRTGSGRR
jgi:hypothetical protein